MSGVGHPTARAATTLSGLALLSPVAGMAVEIALAWRFGASPTVDAFRIGALLLLFGQQLFVLQILPHAVVPVFSEYRARGEEQEAWHVALSLANLLVVPALLVSLLVILYPKPVVGLLAPGLAGEAKELAALFIRWFLPTCVLLVWNGVAVGVLYAHDVFAVPPAAQLLGNLVLVAAILTLGRALGPTSLVIAVLASAVLGSLLYASRLFPLMRQAGARPSWKLDIRHPGVRKSLKLAAPLLGTILLSQWISVVGNRALSGLPPGNIALFGYAWKLGQLVLLVPLSLATVLFPRLADARFSRPVGEFPELCIRALRMALFIAIPLACLLFIFRVRLVTLLFERGAFSAEASRAVAGLFALLLLGAPAAAVAVNLEKMFYAGQQTRVSDVRPVEQRHCCDLPGPDRRPPSRGCRADAAVRRGSGVDQRGPSVLSAAAAPSRRGREARRRLCGRNSPARAARRVGRRPRRSTPAAGRATRSLLRGIGHRRRPGHRGPGFPWRRAGPACSRGSCLAGLRALAGRGACQKRATRRGTIGRAHGNTKR